MSGETQTKELFFSPSIRDPCLIVIHLLNIKSDNIFEQNITQFVRSFQL